MEGVLSVERLEEFFSSLGLQRQLDVAKVLLHLIKEQDEQSLADLLASLS